MSNLRLVRRGRPRVVGAGPEILESRELLATFVVTNVSDDLPALPGSLRAAINEANANPGADTINFNVGGGSQTQTIVVAGIPLPPLSDQVKIDGTTQPGYNGQPVIIIDGVNAGGGASGFRVEANNTIIQGLTINQFGFNGIDIDSSNVTVRNCYIGTDATGEAAAGNARSGIAINGGSGNTIGGDTIRSGNLISGNGSAGVTINFGSNNRIVNNLIGTDESGGLAIPNTAQGVLVVGGSSNSIGGQNVSDDNGITQDRNVISGNGLDGVLIEAGAKNSQVQGNLIGTDITDLRALPNGSAGTGVNTNGVHISDATQVTVGGTGIGVKNVISGNTGAGILLDQQSSSAMIQGNDIGTDANGTVNLGNGGAGIQFGVDAPPTNTDYVLNSTVGGTTTGAPNVIAFNGAKSSMPGILVAGGSSGITILSNSIFANTGSTTQPGGIRFSTKSTNNNALVQQAPNLTNVVSGAGRTLIQGTLNGTVGAQYVVQFFSTDAATGADPSGFGQGRTLVGQATVTLDNTGSATFSITLQNPTTIGSILSATATDPSGDTSQFSNSMVVAAASLSDLAVTIVANPISGTLGLPITYTVTVTNNGPASASGVSVSDTLATSLIFQSATASQGTYTTNGQVVTATLGTIAAGKSATLVIKAQTTQTGTIANAATVTSNQIDPNTSNNTAKSSTQVNIPADLGITLAATPTTEVVGNQLAYLAVVTNNGPGAATGSVVTLNLPAGVTYLSTSAGQGTYSFANGVVTANLGTIPIGVSAAVRVLVSPLTAGSLTATATVTSDENDPVSGNNSATITTTVQPAADLSLLGSATPASGTVGQTLTYTLAVTNSGPSAATNVRLTDLLPQGVVYVGATTSQGTVSQANGTVTVSLGSLDPLGTASVVVTVVPTASKLLVDGATVSSDLLDPVSTNNTVTISTPVSPANTGVALSFAPGSSAPLIGQNTIIDMLVTNNGPSIAGDVVVTNTLPANVTYVGAAPPQGILSVAGNVVTVQLGNLSSGASVLIPIVVTPNTSGSITDSASVISTNYDPDSANNSSTLTAAVSPADLAVTATAGAASTLLGGQVAYSVTLANNGPADATNVLLTSPIPAGATYVSATTTVGTIVTTGTSVIGNVGTLASGATVQLVFTFTPKAVGNLTASFTASSDETDNNPSNNTATATTNVYTSPGSFVFSSSNYQVSQSGGSAVLTIDRVGGSTGSATVNVSTFGGSATSGVDYSPINQVVLFADGQTTATVTIPILDDGKTQPNLNVGVALGSPSNGTSVGATSTALLTIINAHPDLSGPQVLGIIQLGGARSTTGIQIGFNRAVAASAANLISNYQVTASNGRVQAIRSAVYDPNSNSVTLTFVKPLPAGKFYQVIINGSTAGALAGAANGSALDGDGNGVAGGNYVATFIRSSTIRYTDATGNLVTLSLSRGGYLDLFRNAAGQGQTLTINGITPYRSILSGTVKARGATATGSTSLTAITGLTNFGEVKSTLTQPPFFVANSPAVVSTLSVDHALSTPEELFSSVFRKTHRS